MSKTPKIPVVTDMISGIDNELGKTFGEFKPLYNIAKYIAILSNPTTLALFAGYKIAPYFFTSKALDVYKTVGIKCAKLTGKGLLNAAKYTSKGIMASAKLAKKQSITLGNYFKEKNISKSNAPLSKNEIKEEIKNDFKKYRKYPKNKTIDNNKDTSKKQEKTNNEHFVFDEIIIGSDTKAVFTMDINKNIYQQFIIGNNKCAKCAISENDYNNFKQDALSKQEKPELEIDTEYGR